MTFSVGDRVSITKDVEELPQSQHVYVGLIGTVKLVDAQFVYVVPNVPFLIDSNEWVVFYANQLTLLEQNESQ